jgi:peptidoglycan/LPS O-acetylase OafA/YrhL
MLLYKPSSAFVVIGSRRTVLHFLALSHCFGSLKSSKNVHFLILALYTVLSFIFGIVSVYKNPKFAFYFPLCRFWQMAVGGLVAYCSHKITNTKINNALSVSGTAAILITVWIINEESLFPGFWALVPTLASACIIQAGSEALINKHVLSNKVMVFVGKISYPMYLWHWPLLVFSRYLFPEGSTSIFGNVFFMIALTVCFSILTYFFVENPIRKIKTRKIVVVLLILMIFVGIWSYLNLRGSRIKRNYFDEALI